MSAERYEIKECELDVLAIAGTDGTRYIDGEEIEARVIRQLRSDLAAVTAERDALRETLPSALKEKLASAERRIAELEKATSEPKLTRNSLVMVPVTPTDAMINAACYLLPSVPRVCIDDAIERAIAAAPPVPAVEVTSELCLRVNRRWMREPGITDEDCGREMISAVQTELGPALGLAVWREPSDDQCIAIHESWMLAHGIIGHGAVLNGMAIFNAAREVMGGGK